MDMTGVQMAEKLGCAKSLVSRYRGQGMPMDSVVKARAWIRANVRPRADPKRAIADARSPFQQSRANREAAEASIAELELARRRKEVVRRDAVERAGFDAGRGLRDAVVAGARRMAAEVAPLTTAAECETVLARELRLLLEAFVTDLRKRIEGAEA